jgi:hypothetical protein
VRCGCGRGGGIRTRDLLLPKQVRCQAALLPVRTGRSEETHTANPAYRTAKPPLLAFGRLRVESHVEQGCEGSSYERCDDEEPNLLYCSSTHDQGGSKTASRVH